MRPQLVILAGGKGTRLGSITTDIPKPMVDIFGKPFLHWLIEDYIKQGFTDIAVNTGYKAHVIEEYPWPYRLFFFKDSKCINPDYFYTMNPEVGYCNHIVVNGDTWICDDLPTDISSPWILSCGDTDAGAQFVSEGKIKIIKTREFYDIGTPQGLARFKYYFKSYALAQQTHSQTVKKV